MSEDFYAPIHRVEKHGLKTEPSNPTNEPEGISVEENGQLILPPTIEIPNQIPSVTPDDRNQGGINEDLLPSSSATEGNNTDRLWEKPEVLK